MNANPNAFDKHDGNIIKASLLLPPFINCKNCNVILAEFSGEDLIKIHYDDKKCPFCRENIDAWEMVLKYLIDNPLSDMMNSILGFTGFESIIIKNLSIKPLGKYNVDLEKYGVPISAKIHSLTISPYNSDESLVVFPLLLHGNKISKKINSNISFYGAIYNIDSIEQKNDVYDANIKTIDVTPEFNFNIHVIYADYKIFDLCGEHIYYAAEDYLDNNWKNTIINLSIAAEISVSSVCQLYWEKNFTKKETKTLQNRVNYNSKLHCHLVLAANSIHENKIDKPIIEALDKLKKIRNIVIHTGNKNDYAGIEREECVEFFAGVLFLREYCINLINKINGSKEEGQRAGSIRPCLK